MSETTQPITRIGLNKLFLWMEAERLESYPEAFARLQAGQKYTKEMLIKVYRLIYNEKGNPNGLVRSDFMHNLFGLEIASPEKVSIRGVNALREIEPKVYTPTPMALEIGQAYLRRDEPAWLQGLAKMIARYEVRTRLMLYLLGNGESRLVFPRGVFFGMGSSHSELLQSDKRITLFADNAKAFNVLLQDYREVALGRWWTEIIYNEGYEIAPDFIFEGLKKPTPPINKLSDRLKISLFLMKYLGIIQNQGGEWAVNPIRMLEVLGPEIAQDFVSVDEISLPLTPFEWIKAWQSSTQDEAGFIVVSALAKEWAERMNVPLPQAEAELDAWMREQSYHGRVRIIAMHPGQLKLGRGLYGDDGARKIKFEMIEQ